MPGFGRASSFGDSNGESLMLDSGPIESNHDRMGAWQATASSIFPPRPSAAAN